MTAANRKENKPNWRPNGGLQNWLRRPPTPTAFHVGAGARLIGLEESAQFPVR